MNGKDGINGLPGRNGLNGKDGINGLPGRNGIDGKNGKDGEDADVRFVDIKVKICECEQQKDGSFAPKEKEVTVKAIANKDGSSSNADTIKADYEAIYKLSRDACLAKNNDDNYVAIPDSWLLRPEHSRPQAIYQFREVGSKPGENNPPKYTLTIPHHKDHGPDVSPFPKYRKGNWEIIYVLADNSKITIHAANENEGMKILEAAKLLIESSKLSNGYLSKSGRVESKVPMKQIEVECRIVKFWDKGRQKDKPKWVKKY
ncbi:MAG: collagen-like protein [Nostocales cyanobacterium]|nr:MAG: collagen-like protein [Nostocales cyanobacterium]TAF16116.1 MAG: collagen-like protein [Nostocales cyanobacterium]